MIFCCLSACYQFISLTGYICLKLKVILCVEHNCLETDVQITTTTIIIFISNTSSVNNITKDWPELYSMTADPQENFNIASLPEYKEVFESNDDGVDEEDGDDSSRREDVLFLMLGKLTRRRWRIFLERIQYRRISGGDDDDREFLK